MLQISNLKLFLKTKTNHFPFPLKPYFLSNPKTLHKPFSILTKTTISSSSSSRKQPPKFHSLRTRNNSTFSKNRKEMASESMEEVKEEGTSVVGFNKRRAEGKDKNDKPKKNLQLKTRKLNPVSTTSYVQILGTGMDTQDTSPSVLLFFDKQRFIFNAGEGLQRYCTEHKIKLSKVDHILLSRVCSETAGGLPGLLLTLAGMGEEGMSVKIWGSSDLQHLITAMRSFIPHSAMFHTGIVGETPTEPFIDNEVVKIYAILIRPSSSVQSYDSSMLHFSSVGLGDERNQFSEPLFPPASPARIDGSMVKPGDISVIYVCELPEIQGKFDLEKAKALGLKPGPKYRDLQCGKSVKSDKQNVMVHPGDVLGPSVPGPIVLVVDCPTVSHLQELLSVQSLSCYYADSVDHRQHDFKCVNCIIHLSPSSVTMTAAYQNWMKRFGRAQHIMAGHEEKNTEIPILKSSARTAARLNYLCPQFFPASGFWSLQHLKNFAPDLIEDSIPKLCDSISGENLIKFHLRPYTHLGLDKSSIPASISSTAVINELLSEIPDIVHSAKEISQLWVGLAESERAKPHTPESVVMTEEPWISADASVPNIIIDEKIRNASTEIISCPPSCLEDITREDMEIVLLGTGSSQPSKYRNVSSIYVNLFSKGSLLLDCGEGTLGQLKRRFGVKGADDAIRSLRCVWISHIHADHHTGLARILSLRRELLSGDSHEPLLVIGPRQLKSFLDAYQRLEDLDMQFVNCSETTEAKLASFERSFELGDSSPSGSPVGTGSTLNIEKSLFAKGSPMQSYRKRPTSPVDTKILKNLKKVLAEAGLEALISIPVVHCPYAYGIVVKAAERTNRAGKTIPGWKLVYSGDTRPCPELIEASRGATVLIHEATFEDGMVDEAIARNHSTTGEAIDVGNSADVYRIILTHFSQRYPKIPVFDEAHMHKTCIAFDLMSVNVADLPVLPKVVPYFKLLFRNEMISDEVDDFLGPLL